MAEETQDPNEQQPGEEDYVKPNPQDNPRNISLKEIAAKVAKQHVVDAAETVDSVDDDHVITPADPAAEPPAEPAAAATSEESSDTPPSSGDDPAPPAAAAPAPGQIDPAQEYEVTVEGQKIKVPGSKIIEAGIRTYQKESAADFRLKMASELLQEAQARAQAAQATPPGADQQPPAKPADGPSDADLAKALQFGTEEQAANAIAILKSRGAASPEQIAGFVAQQSRAAARDEYLFQEGRRFLESEYGDLLANDHLKRLIILEEQRYRAPKERGGLGDRRPYKDVYKDIGENLRTAFKLQKPSTPAPSGGSTPGSAQARAAAKAKAVPVPKMAAARVSEAAAEKPKTASDIIAGMAASRGKNRLTQPRKE